MKKFMIILLFVCLFALGWFFFANRLDYNKIVMVLPSSKRASSLYFYKKDGDFFLANDLKLGFEKLGYDVEYRYREDYDKIDFGNAGNVIYFKGYYNFKNLPKDDKVGRKYVLYLYYVEDFSENILNEVDVIVSASKSVVDNILIKRGLKTAYVPQFTNPDRFKLAKKDDAFANDVLFVGSNHSREGRQSVKYAIDMNANISVYGKFWAGKLPKNVVKGLFIDNDELHKFYSNAKIVLNDHRLDMIIHGFVSNRIYDVTASGGFMLTDYLPEIEIMYGDSIATYKTFDEFREKLEYYLLHPEEREKMIEKARKITLENYTNYIAAEKFDGILKKIEK